MKNSMTTTNPEPRAEIIELVVALWEQARSRKPKLTLTTLGAGSRMVGVDEVRFCSHEFLCCMERAYDKGYWWDGGWIEAVEEYATAVSKEWAKNGQAEIAFIESLCSKILRKHMEPPIKEKKG